ncbi:hypothetical protein T08_8767 [Trichinella sp. T8]|nr:hypothetical protein T08_8767 [Trichinella sp. T8]
MNRSTFCNITLSLNKINSHHEARSLLLDIIYSYKERLNYTNVFDSGSSSRFSQRTPPSGSHRNFIGGPADKFHWLRCPE